MDLDRDFEYILAALERIEDNLGFLARIIFKEGRQMAQIDDEITALAADVASERAVVDSATKLLNGISAKIDAAVAAALAAGATATELQAIADASAAIKAQTADLSAAVASNTPHAPAP